MSANQDTFLYPWEQEQDTHAKHGVMGFVAAYAIICLTLSVIAWVFNWRWGFNVTAFGEVVFVSWAQVLMLGIPIGAALTIRSKGGGLLATLGVFLLLVATVLAYIAFGGGVGIWPTL